MHMYIALEENPNFLEMCRLCEEISRKVCSIDLTVLIPRKL